MPLSSLPAAAVSGHGEVSITPLSFRDAPAVRRMLERTSPESMYKRFLVPIPRISEGWFGRFFAPPEGLVLAARNGVDDVVGLAHVIRTGEKTADIAVLVEDAWHHRGVGLALFLHVVEVARLNDITVLRGEILRENHAALALLRRVFPQSSVRCRGYECEFAVELAAQESALPKAG